MYTDTKNLANLCVNNTNASAKVQNNQEQHHKLKLRKVWKPIWRLISQKSAAATAAKTRNTLPNNVNLNNANTSISHKPKDLLFSSELAAAEEEDNEQCHHTQKLPEFAQSSQTETEADIIATQPLEFIRRVSVDKTPINTCNNCVHGRNCQHSAYHQMEESVNEITNSPPVQHHPHQDFNFIKAEDGCFVWSDTYGDIDEQLLRQWLWQNAWQFAENATVC